MRDHSRGIVESSQMVAGEIELILFDLDGTLVDSVGDMAWCGNEMLRSLGMRLHNPDAARNWVGNGLERFIKRVLTNDMNAEPDAELFSAGLEIFNRFYANHASDHSELYPGAVETLEYLAGLNLRLACVTNKPEPFTSDLIAAMGLTPYFGLVVAGDTTPEMKPHPMPLQFAADHYGIPCEKCLMVGDSSNDVQAAHAAGFHIICVPYGYNHGNDIRDSGPDRVIENLTELKQFFIRGKT